MALSQAAEKLYAWLQLYKLQPKDYNNNLKLHPKAQRRGAFVAAFEELLVEYGS